MEFSRVFEIVNNKLIDWLESIIALLPNMVVALLVLIAFYFLGKILKAAFKKIFNRISGNTAVVNLFASILNFTIIILGLLIALNVLHLEQTVTSILAGAGILGIAIGFAFQDISSNFISGIIIAIRKPIKVGDIIQTSDYIGKVERIDLRVTVIKTFQGLHVLVPNKEIFQGSVTNYTLTEDRRVDVEVGVSYAEDLEKVRDVTIKAIEDLNIKLEGTDIGLFYTLFDSSSINFTLTFWIHYPDEPGFLKARSDAIIAIKKAYDENGITIPFPIRTLDFGIKGGQTLSEMDIK